MGEIGRIEIEIVETDDPNIRAVKVSVAKGGRAYTKRGSVAMPADSNARSVVFYTFGHILYRDANFTDFFDDPEAHADPIEPSREAEFSCPL